MTGPTPRTRSEELLLARISAAAGRAHLGRRLATYAATACHPRTRAGLYRAIRRLPARAWYGRSPATRASPNARLDLYEHGMTVAVKGRIHVVRYETTSVFRHSTRPRGTSLSGTTLIHTLTDVQGKRLVLHGSPEGGDARAWEHEVRRAVTRARLPGALAALRRGERVSFGDIWLTTEQVGSGEMCTPWPQVQRITMTEGFLTVTVDGRQHRLGPAVSTIPNVFVFRALVEHCRTKGAH
uniref:Transposase n=1 Tax=Streptomyces sp. NBC_00003 TaxID=2903608 RepID=A0AAU2UXM6_9ACTN